MLTKKVRVDQFVVEYFESGGQHVSYLETAEIFEDGISIGSLRPEIKSIPIESAESVYQEISLGGWDIETAYVADDIVSFAGQYYHASQASTGEEPGEASLFWDVLPVPTETERIIESIKKATAVYTQDILEDEASTEVDLAALADIYPSWKAWSRFTAGDVVAYSGLFYRAVTTHVTQPTWTPDVAVALWTRVHIGDTVPAWTQPLGSHDAYPAGYRVTHNGSTWISDVDANVWEPGVSSWTEEVPETPTIEAWVQPLGAQDAYQIDDMVTHNGQTWISINADNVWEPGVFGWTVV